MLLKPIRRGKESRDHSLDGTQSPACKGHVDTVSRRRHRRRHPEPASTDPREGPPRVAGGASAERCSAPWSRCCGSHSPPQPVPLQVSSSSPVPLHLLSACSNPDGFSLLSPTAMHKPADTTVRTGLQDTQPSGLCTSIQATNRYVLPDT